jgi:putative flippase GtrA
MKLSQATAFEIMRFLLVGGLAVLIDGSVYFFLIDLEITDASWAKRLSFLIGSFWAFFMNKYFTFRQKGFSFAEPVLFGLVYLTGFILNSLIHDLVLVISKTELFAFTLATSVSTVSNFLGQKLVVFKSQKSSNE